MMLAGLHALHSPRTRTHTPFGICTQMNLQTMLSMRHVTPFREEAQNELQILSDTSDTLERW